MTDEGRIVRFLTRDFTESEKEDLEIWMNEDPENRKSFEETKKIWDHSANIKDFQSNDKIEDWLKVKRRINFERSKYPGHPLLKENMIRFLRAAAVIIILLGIGILARQYIFRQPEMILVSTGDFKKEIILPDGSQVFLNKYSKFKYPERFQKNRRQVDLTGEGYFDVTEDPDKLFRININSHAIVEVLGTSFNLKSHSADGSVDIHVISGKVSFFTPDTKANKTILTKGEQAFLRKGAISVTESKDTNFLSWKTGILNFNDERIENVLEELTTFYNKKFKLKNTCENDIRLTSRFDNQKLESVLEEIKLVLKLDYTLDADTIIFYFR
jgi:ferric-dicitrate binding protein FerR (iron transport regulator)